MKLELATYQAIKYACRKFHYSRSVPSFGCSFSVFNGAGEWCGVIIYAPGSNRYLGNKFGLRQGEVCELVRVALNGKQESTSKAVGISLKLLKKYNPLLKLIVSYADCDQEHVGTIYQATNWIYEGQVELNGGTPKVRLFGKVTHGRTIGKRGWPQKLDWLKLHVDPKAEFVYTTGKHKYLFPLTNELRTRCLPLHKPYPKKILAAVA